MRVFVVTTEECDDMGNVFQDFHGVFKSVEEATMVKEQIDIYNEDELIEIAQITEYEL